MNTIYRTQLAVATQNDPRWASVVSRDAQADGSFYYSVASSGVYCRPSCAARLARPENVRFHTNTQAAEQAGFRACKRCKPDRYAADAEQAPQTPQKIAFSIGVSAIGRVLVARSERGVCAILLGDDDNALASQLQQRFANSELTRDDVSLQLVLAQVAGFVDQPQGDLDVPLDAHGSDFQQRVWQALRSIPAGATASYTDIAQRIGSPHAVRAVAAACAANPLAVVIPCHRVIKRDGSLSGFRWGVERKRALLAREAQA
ncbi:methylated-DNA--[protein]-cysteine S-methyltransferase [Luteimonas sp. SX5]|uniref:Methylated-DNA--[protein]-cysteine S-methyltransferase n=1 Tax=Luteimonas galliterrae TaxID=2940486 RepID=A0ABT0MJH7_9GAMM|nr:methylated-DNA--[protein]-cysteine S-methyltransferase [Luteimonas galliterrae]MCL1635013.1 methylated-DNA--[protein]-cysteine S-methyltransferase [Luteimonas galliterrae]